VNENNQAPKKESQKNKVWVKILVPTIIAIAIVGIFIFKNMPLFEKESNPNQTIKQSGEVTSLQATDMDYSSVEFALDATNTLDMEQILSYGLPVIIDFGADSCIPCKEMAPVLEELNEELRGKAIVKFVDVWKNADASQVVPIRVIPTQFFFDKDGKPYVPESQEEGFIMYEHQETNEHIFTAHEGGMSKEQILAVLKELGVK
jgi:thioredoxin 1